MKIDDVLSLIMEDVVLENKSFYIKKNEYKNSSDYIVSFKVKTDFKNKQISDIKLSSKNSDATVCYKDGTNSIFSIKDVMENSSSDIVLKTAMTTVMKKIYTDLAGSATSPIVKRIK